MHREIKRIFKILGYKVLMYIPTLILFTYIFFKNFMKDIDFTIAFTLFTVLTAYLYEWGIDNYKTHQLIVICGLIAWIVILSIGFILSGVDKATKEKDQELKEQELKEQELKDQELKKNDPISNKAVTTYG